MAERVAGAEIERLIQLLARLPGLGPRSARRAALHLISKREELLAPLADAMQTALRENPRLLAMRQYRYARSLHHLPRPAARSKRVRGGRERRRSLGAGARRRRSTRRYHVLGGTLSPLDGVGPQDINIDDAGRRASPKAACSEVILALNATVDGQTTAHYVTDLLARPGRQGDAARAWRAGRRRARLSRRGHALGRDPPAHGVLTRPLPPAPSLFR